MRYNDAKKLINLYGQFRWSWFLTYVNLMTLINFSL